MAAPIIVAAGQLAKRIALEKAIKKGAGMLGGGGAGGGKFKLLVIFGAIGPTAMVVVLVLALVVAVSSTTDHMKNISCETAAGGVGTVGGGGPGDISERQTRYARIIIGIAKTEGISQRGWIVALATALQESQIQVYANSRIPESMNVPHDAVGNDHMSVGIFQQQVGLGWSTHPNDDHAAQSAQLMDPAYSAQAFFGGANGNPRALSKGLRNVEGWEQMPISVAAQKVQISAYPDAYAKWEGRATELAVANADAPPVPLPVPFDGDANGATPGGGGGGAGDGSNCPAGGGTLNPHGGGDATDILANPRLQFTRESQRQDLATGRIDARVVAMLRAILEKHTITITSLRTDHGQYTTNGSVSNHYHGRAVDIGIVDGETVTPSSGAARLLSDELRASAPTTGLSELGQPFYNTCSSDNPCMFTAGHDDHIHFGFDG